MVRLSAKNIFGKGMESNYNINGINREKPFQVQLYDMKFRSLLVILGRNDPGGGETSWVNSGAGA